MELEKLNSRVRRNIKNNVNKNIVGVQQGL
jgi:hypothetical protein